VDPNKANKLAFKKCNVQPGEWYQFVTRSSACVGLVKELDYVTGDIVLRDKMIAVSTIQSVIWAGRTHGFLFAKNSTYHVSCEGPSEVTGVCTEVGESNVTIGNQGAFCF
jgi:hypothetical protein